MRSLATFRFFFYELLRLIVFDEDFAGFFHHRPPRPFQNRMEAWETLLSGGTGYDHLDMTFTPDDPEGRGKCRLSKGLPQEWFDGRKLRDQLQYLATLLQSLDLAAMHPQPELVKSTPIHTKAVVFAHQNHFRYLVYLGDCRSLESEFGEKIYAGKLEVRKLKSNYQARWIDPKTGKLLRETMIEQGTTCLNSPSFREDLLLDLEVI